MRTSFSPQNNPRVIIIQKLYGKFFNDDQKLVFPKHRFKKFIKDIVTGTIERDELILDELNKNYMKLLKLYKRINLKLLILFQKLMVYLNILKMTILRLALQLNLIKIMQIL